MGLLLRSLGLGRSPRAWSLPGSVKGTSRHSQEGTQGAERPRLQARGRHTAQHTLAWRRHPVAGTREAHSPRVSLKAAESLPQKRIAPQPPEAAPVPDTARGRNPQALKIGPGTERGTATTPTAPLPPHGTGPGSARPAFVGLEGPGPRGTRETVPGEHTAACPPEHAYNPNFTRGAGPGASRPS